MRFRMSLLALATVAAGAGGALTTATPAFASNTCPSSDAITTTAAGAVTSSDPADWYSYTTTIPRQVRLGAGGQANGRENLKIRNSSCASAVCEFNDGLGADQVCSIPAGSYNIGVVLYSGTSASYTITITSIQCSDGDDNDGDGFTDYPADPNCYNQYDNVEAAPVRDCNDGIDNDGDGYVDFPADPGCTSESDDSEGVACTDVSGVEVCAGLSTGSQIARLAVDNDAITTNVVAYLDVYRFVVAGTPVSLPCVTFTAVAPVNACAAAGGTFVSRTSTLVNQPVSLPNPVVAPSPVSVGVCNAELQLTAAGIGLPSVRAYTVC